MVRVLAPFRRSPCQMRPSPRLVIAWLIDWQLALLSLLVLPFLYWSFGMYGKRIVPRLTWKIADPAPATGHTHQRANCADQGSRIAIRLLAGGIDLSEQAGTDGSAQVKKRVWGKAEE